MQNEKYFALKDALGDKLKQSWLRKELDKKGFKINPATLSRWCTTGQRPRYDALINAIAEILNIEKENLLINKT